MLITAYLGTLCLCGANNCLPWNCPCVLPCPPPLLSWGRILSAWPVRDRSQSSASHCGRPDVCVESGMAGLVEPLQYTGTDWIHTIGITQNSWDRGEQQRARARGHPQCVSGTKYLLWSEGTVPLHSWGKELSVQNDTKFSLTHWNLCPWILDNNIIAASTHHTY